MVKIMGITTLKIRGKEYVYVQYYDPFEGKQVRFYCGSKDNPNIMEMAQGYDKRFELEKTFRSEMKEASQFIDTESDLEIVKSVKLAVVLKKAYDVLLYAKYMYEKEKHVARLDIHRMLDRIGRLIAKYHPQFDPEREVKEEFKLYEEKQYFALHLWVTRVVGIVKVAELLGECEEADVIKLVVYIATDVLDELKIDTATIIPVRSSFKDRWIAKPETAKSQENPNLPHL